MARATAAPHVSDAGTVLPAVQAAQAPLQAAEARPAWSPNVPAGHSSHVCEPAAEAKVPGLHGTQGAKPEPE